MPPFSVLFFGMGGLSFRKYMLHFENSAAIDRAPGARSTTKSDEIFKCIILVVEIILALCLKPPKRCFTFWDPESSILHDVVF